MVNTRCSKAAFSDYAVQLWNHLSENIKSAPSISTFKSQLKAKLFSDAFVLLLVFIYLFPYLFIFYILILRTFNVMPMFLRSVILRL